MTQPTPTWTLIEIEDPEARSAACATIIAELPNWFGIPEANASYIAGVAKTFCFAAKGENGDLLGMLSLRVPFPNNADIYWLGVLPDRHRQGIGRVLAEAAFEKARAIGCDSITVETLGTTMPDEGYARTRAFYSGMGFKPLFELEPYDTKYAMLYMGRAL